MLARVAERDPAYPAVRRVRRFAAPFVFLLVMLLQRRDTSGVRGVLEHIVDNVMRTCRHLVIRMPVKMAE